MRDYSELENALGYAFSEPSLLETALTHASWTNEHGDPNNERLEFLGDAVLQFAISSVVFDRVPRDEGQLTAVRQALVKGVSLAAVATRLELGAYLRMGRSGDKDKLRSNKDVLEDAGINSARSLVERLLSHEIDSLVALAAIQRVTYGNSKSELNERCSSIWKQPPAYQLVSESGDPAMPCFVMEVRLPDGRAFRGEGRKKQLGEFEAARLALLDLG